MTVAKGNSTGPVAESDSTTPVAEAFRSDGISGGKASGGAWRRTCSVARAASREAMEAHRGPTGSPQRQGASTEMSSRLRLTRSRAWPAGRGSGEQGCGCPPSFARWRLSDQRHLLDQPLARRTRWRARPAARATQQPVPRPPPGGPRPPDSRSGEPGR
jgi:hypothetical protein